MDVCGWNLQTLEKNFIIVFIVPLEMTEYIRDDIHWEFVVFFIFEKKLIAYYIYFFNEIKQNSCRLSHDNILSSGTIGKTILCQHQADEGLPRY